MREVKCLSPKMRVEFEYAIGSTVRLKKMEIEATVAAVKLDNDGPMFYVIYWWEGTRKTDWVFPWELT
jgi:hypothetical protein